MDLVQARALDIVDRVLLAVDFARDQGYIDFGEGQCRGNNSQDPDRKLVRRMRKDMFVKRVLSSLDLLPIDLKTWRKGVWEPSEGRMAYGNLPEFTFG